MNPGFADWYDISDPRAILAMAAIDISKADKLRDRREMKRVFHAFGVVTNEADGRKVALYKTEGVELSTPVKTQAEDSTPFTDDKVAYYLSTVNSGGKIWDN